MADKLHGHMDRNTAEYKHVVMALIFLGGALRRSLGIYPGPRKSQIFSDLSRIQSREFQIIPIDE